MIIEKVHFPIRIYYMELLFKANAHFRKLSGPIYNFISDFLSGLNSEIYPESHKAVLTEPVPQKHYVVTQLVTHNENRPDENKLCDKELPAGATQTLITVMSLT